MENEAQAQIRQALTAWEKAVHEQDIDTLMAFYAPCIVAFDVIPPLRFQGIEAYRKNWQMGFEMCQNGGTFEMHELHIAAGERVAFCHRLQHMSGKSAEGEPFDSWIRWTTCFENIEGRWLITHEHISLPIDMQTGQGLMDLKPSDG